MFCLRIWLLPLFFLSSAPPLYLLLFLSATYILQRPCVYCSLLLAVLVLVLFDFNRNWFEPVSDTPSGGPSSNSTSSIHDVLAEGVSVAAAVMNGTAGALAETVMEYVGKSSSPAETAATSLTRMGTEWFKTILTRRELRIPCVNAVIRL